MYLCMWMLVVACAWPANMAQFRRGENKRTVRVLYGDITIFAPAICAIAVSYDVLC